MSFYIDKRDEIKLSASIRGENIEEVEEMSKRFQKFFEK